MKHNGHLDLLDRAVLMRLQDDYPLCERPWEELGRELGIPGREVLRRTRRLRERGYIRSIAPILEPSGAGWGANTLVALKVPEQRLPEVANEISRYPEVSHCYRRDHDFNLWFTLAIRNDDTMDERLEEIRVATGLREEDLISLPTLRRIKIDVRFRFREEDERGSN